MLRVTIRTVSARSRRILGERKKLGDVLFEAVLKYSPLHLLTVEEVKVGAEKCALQVF